MIALDSSSLIAFLEGAAGGDTELVEQSLTDRQACLPPVVLTELLSDPKLPKPSKSFSSAAGYRARCRSRGRCLARATWRAEGGPFEEEGHHES